MLYKYLLKLKSHCEFWLLLLFENIEEKNKKSVLLNVCLYFDKCVWSLCGPRVIIIHSMCGVRFVQKVSYTIRGASPSGSRRRPVRLLVRRSIRLRLAGRRDDLWKILQWRSVSGGRGEGSGSRTTERKVTNSWGPRGTKATSGITSWARIANFILKCPRLRRH